MLKENMAYGQALVSPGRLQLQPVFAGDNRAKILTVKACGICHSDRKAWYSPPGGMQLPRILGHEVAGTLEVDLPNLGLKAGDLVALWPAVTCGTCRFCLAGRKNLCPGIKLFGYHLDGGFSNSIYLAPGLIPRLRVWKIPPGTGPAQAGFAEPLACVLNGLQKVAVDPESCLVIGAGTMGRLAGRAAGKLWQTSVYYHDTEPLRLERAGADGQPWRPGLMADLVFIAASAGAALEFGFRHLAPGGTMVLFSGLPGKAELSCLHNELHQQEQCLVGAYGCTPGDLSRAVAWLAAQEIVVDDLFTGRISLAELPGELARIPGPEEFKTVVIF